MIEACGDLGLMVQIIGSILLVLHLAFICVVIVIMLYWLLFFATWDVIMDATRLILARVLLSYL